MNMKKPANKKCLKFIFCKLLQCQHLQDCTIKWLHRENRVIRSKSHNIFDFPIDFFFCSYKRLFLAIVVM